MNTTLAQNKFDKAEAFLNLCTVEGLRMTLEATYQLSTVAKQTKLVTVYRNKEELLEAIVRQDEDTNGALSDWGKEHYRNMSMVELKLVAKRMGVSLAKRVYKDVVAPLKKQQLIDKLLYETDYADGWE